MRDEVEVRIPDPADDLLEEGLRLILSDVVILDVVVQFPAVCELHDDEDVVGGVQHLVQLDDVLMTDKLEDLDLPLYLTHPTCTLEIMFLFFILRLLMIFTATFTPVISCLASASTHSYLLL